MKLLQKKPYALTGRERDQVVQLMARVADAQKALGAVIEHIAARERVDLSRFAFSVQTLSFVPRAAPESPKTE